MRAHDNSTPTAPAFTIKEPINLIPVSEKTTNSAQTANINRRNRLATIFPAIQSTSVCKAKALHCALAEAAQFGATAVLAGHGSKLLTLAKRSHLPQQLCSRWPLRRVLTPGSLQHGANF